MSTEESIKALIICAGGKSSSLLESKTIEAARKAGVDLDMLSINLLDAERWNYESHGIDIILIAPQIRFMRQRIAEASKRYQVIVEAIDTLTYGMVDGEKLFNRIMSAMEIH
jgi:PTS system cellobiose-specific IIB component